MRQSSVQLGSEYLPRPAQRRGPESGIPSWAKMGISLVFIALRRLTGKQKHWCQTSEKKRLFMSEGLSVVVLVFMALPELYILHVFSSVVYVMSSEQNCHTVSLHRFPVLRICYYFVLLLLLLLYCIVLYYCAYTVLCL
jgi:hypothetical protein